MAVRCQRSAFPFALALLCAALASCDPGSKSALAPAPVERATTVVVRDALDAPVEGVPVTAVHLDGTEAIIGTTDAAGAAHFTLVAGRWAVSASVASGGGAPSVAGSTGTVPGDTFGAHDTVLFRLRLAPGSVVSGDVRLAGRVDHSGTLVSLDELPLFTLTDATGAWTLTGLPPGIWTGLANHLSFRTGVFDVIVLAPADTFVVADTLLLQPAPVPAPGR